MISLEFVTSLYLQAPHTHIFTVSGGIVWCSSMILCYTHILIVPFQAFEPSGHQSPVYGGWCMGLSCNSLCFSLQAQHHLWETHLTAINHARSHPQTPSISLLNTSMKLARYVYVKFYMVEVWKDFGVLVRSESGDSSISSYNYRICQKPVFS